MRVKIVYLTGIAFELNHALDSGKYASITVDDVKQQIRAGKVFDFLEQRLGSDIDVSLLYNDDRAELVREWQQMDNAIDEVRKYGVERSGLHLLVAYLLEGIQQRSMKGEAE